MGTSYSDCTLFHSVIPCASQVSPEFAFSLMNGTMVDCLCHPDSRTLRLEH